MVVAPLLSRFLCRSRTDVFDMSSVYAQLIQADDLVGEGRMIRARAPQEKTKAVNRKCSMKHLFPGEKGRVAPFFEDDGRILQERSPNEFGLVLTPFKQRNAGERILALLEVYEGGVGKKHFLRIELDEVVRHYRLAFFVERRDIGWSNRTDRLEPGTPPLVELQAVEDHAC